MNIIIRKAQETDAEGIVYVNTNTWVTTYKEIVPDSVIRNRINSMGDRMIEVAKNIKEKDNMYVAINGDKVIGVMSYGISRNEEYSKCGEIYSHYVLRDYQGLGLGTKLFKIGINTMLDNGINEMIINVLDKNKNIKFYEKFGGKNVGTQAFDYEGDTLKNNIIYFSNIKTIVNR